MDGGTSHSASFALPSLSIPVGRGGLLFISLLLWERCQSGSIMKTSIYFILAMLAGVGFTSTSARAEMVTVAGVGSSFDPSFPGCSDSGTNYASVSCSGAGFTADAWALADWGTMKIFTEATRTTSDWVGFQAGAYLRVRDYFTVSNATPGDTFEMAFSLDGNITIPPSGTCGGAGCSSDASLGINAALSNGGSLCQTTTTLSYSAADPYTCVMDLTLTNPTTSLFSNIDLQTAVELRSFATGIVDFSNTLQVTRVVVLRPDGSIDTNAAIQPLSGFLYPTGEMSTVPEPSSVSMVMVGLGVLVAARRRIARFVG